jgi:hypothetical protein
MKCSHTHVVKIKQEEAIANGFPGGLASSDDLAAAHVKAEVKDELKVEENNFKDGLKSCDCDAGGSETCEEGGRDPEDQYGTPAQT